MRILYIIFYPFISLAVILFYKKIKSVNKPKSIFNRTIYAGNHAASFMDPLVVATSNKAVVYFMTRSDVFTTFSKPFLWAFHMLPIYRQQDGVDTKEKNAEVFQKCTDTLMAKKNLLIYPEGLTDDVFIRRLKPIKKGAVRIGFIALEATDWKEKIYVTAIGCNYTCPNAMRSELLISNSDPICLNDYRTEYESNSYKVISELTAKVEELMKAQITHIEREDWSEFHEQIMIISAKGMNHLTYDKSLTLEQRWMYSKNLANWLNTFSEIIPDEISNFKTQLSVYFEKLKNNQILDCDLKSKKDNSYSVFLNLLAIIALFPLATLGALHCYLPYRFIKNFVEKKFKRDVFWGSTKMILGLFIFSLFNVPIVAVLTNYLNQPFWIGLIYFVSLSMFWLSFVNVKLKINQFVRISKIKRLNTDSLVKMRQELEERIQQIVPKF
jgi:hypothetical protein